MRKTILNYYFISIVFIQLSFIDCISLFDYSHLKGEPLTIMAGSLSSKRAIIPFGYNKLNICQSKKVEKEEDSLGELLRGESYYTTGYMAKTNEDKFCEILCYNNFTSKTVKVYTKLIRRNYFSNWFLDKLPAGLIKVNKEEKLISLDFFNGIPLGFQLGGQYFIYNHLQFHILLNKIGNNRFNVVGFNILPISINHDNEKPICATEAKEIFKNLEKPFQPLKEGNILFTYDIVYEYSDITFASRWDHYKPSKEKIHWTGIFISEALLTLISIFIIYIFKKNVNKNIDDYNYRVSQFEDIDEYDWKQVAGDVFRSPPSNRVLLLSSILGTGTQLLIMLSISLFLGVLGFMKPERRANILNIGILLFILCGFFAGYISASFYRFWGKRNWLKVAIATSSLFPGTLFFGYILINIVLTFEKSNAAVNFSDIVSLFLLWIFCTFPLVLIGSFFGFKSKRFNSPCTVNKIPSIIPSKPWYLNKYLMTFLTGLIGFSTIFIEFNYVMSALWGNQIYFMALYLWIIFIIFILIVGESTILVVYFNLCYGDYNWWWNSFNYGSSPVIYFILYSIFYFFYLKITRLSAMMVYFGTMGLISAMVVLICGTTSVFLTWAFLNKIYSKLRID